MKLQVTPSPPVRIGPGGKDTIPESQDAVAPGIRCGQKPSLPLPPAAPPTHRHTLRAGTPVSRLGAHVVSSTIIYCLTGTPFFPIIKKCVVNCEARTRRCAG